VLTQPAAQPCGPNPHTSLANKALKAALQSGAAHHHRRHIEMHGCQHAHCINSAAVHQQHHNGQGLPAEAPDRVPTTRPQRVASPAQSSSAGRSPADRSSRSNKRHQSARPKGALCNPESSRHHQHPHRRNQLVQRAELASKLVTCNKIDSLQAQDPALPNTNMMGGTACTGRHSAAQTYPCAKSCC
jgi:hypothetical protein